MSYSFFTRRREISPPPPLFFLFCFGNLFYSESSSSSSCQQEMRVQSPGLYLNFHPMWMYTTMRLLVFSLRYIPHTRSIARQSTSRPRKRAKGGGLTNKVRMQRKVTHSHFSFSPFTGKHSLTRFPACHFLPPSWATSSTVLFLLISSICLTVQLPPPRFFVCS